MSSVYDAQQYPPTSAPDAAQPHPAEQTTPHLMVVREDTAPATYPPPAVPAEPAQAPPGQLATAQAKAAVVGEQVRKLVTPPDIVSKDMPSLTKIREYGASGTAVPENGALRAASKAWSWFAMYHAARGYLRAWLMQRPARAVVFLVLVGLAALIPWTRVALTVLLWPAHLVIELITNF